MYIINIKQQFFKDVWSKDRVWSHGFYFYHSRARLKQWFLLSSNDRDKRYGARDGVSSPR